MERRAHPLELIPGLALSVSSLRPGGTHTHTQCDSTFRQDNANFSHLNIRPLSTKGHLLHLLHVWIKHGSIQTTSLNDSTPPEVGFYLWTMWLWWWRWYQRTITRRGRSSAYVSASLPFESMVLQLSGDWSCSHSPGVSSSQILWLICHPSPQ